MTEDDWRSLSAPATDDGKKELARMRRLHNLTGDLWGANRALVTLLLASAAWIGFKVGDGSGSVPLLLVVITACATVLASAAYFLVRTMAFSRAGRADESATKRRQDYPMLAVLFILEAVLIPVAAALQGYSVYKAVNEGASTLDGALSDRLGLFLVDPQARFAVDTYCAKHSADESASPAFLRACAMFAAPSLPSPEEVTTLRTELTR